MLDRDVRWIQRYSNFEQIVSRLKETLQIKEPSVIERAGLIQFFELAFELSWKLLKDYEQAEGLEAQSPREAIKRAYAIELISDGHGWIDMLAARNLTTCTYQEEVAQAVEQLIRKRYYPLMESLHEAFKAKVEILEDDPS